MTTTISVGIRIEIPISVVAEKTGAAMTPARPARAHPTQKTAKNSRATLMPSAEAMASFSTPARIMAPSCVLAKTAQRTAMTARPTAIINRR